MPQENPFPRKKQGDHLNLLVGNNVVPNIVAGQLLVPEDQPTPTTRTTFVYSQETEGHAVSIHYGS